MTKVAKLFIIFLFVFFLPFNICFVCADTQSDISVKEAISIIKEYEAAYMNKDLKKMLGYVDQTSTWFQIDFLDEFKAIFRSFDNIRLYHFKDESYKTKYQVYYIVDGVEVGQNTLYVAYSRSATDVNEFTEIYYLKKVKGKYKIAECKHFPADDVKLVDDGTGAMLKNDIEKAISYFNKAIEINPRNSVAYFRLGMIYSKTGKNKEALQALKKAIELRPDVGFYRFYLSQGYVASGDKEKASEEMEEAVALDPELKTFVNEKK